MNLWTVAHAKTLIPTMIVELIMACILGFTLRNKSEKIKMIPVQAIAVMILVLEVIKQIYCFTRPGGYDFYMVPLHFCSLFLLVLPLFAFYRGKYR